MLLPSSTLGAVGLVVFNFVFWGHWTICQKFAGYHDARCTKANPIPSAQAFAVIMVVAQCAATLLLCLTFGYVKIDGSPDFTNDTFTAAIARDSSHTTSVALVMAGGAALAVGDFAASVGPAA